MSSVQQRVAKAGLARDAVRTTGYSIQQEFDFANGRRIPRDYVARNGIEVRLDGVERVGELSTRSSQAGATTVTGVRFDLKDRAAAERDALRLAVVDARGRADAHCGRRRPHDRPRDPRSPTTPQPRFKAADADGDGARLATAAAVETPIEAGTIEIHAQVELVAAIK